MSEVVPLIKPKPITILDMDGEPINVVLSRFPATVGREMLCSYPLTALPKIGDYRLNHELMLKLMKYVAVDVNGHQQRLLTEALVNNHLADGEACLKVELAMMEYNSTFFRNGRLSTFFDDCLSMIVAKISEMLIPLSPQSSGEDSQPSTNSEPSTI